MNIPIKSDKKKNQIENELGVLLKLIELQNKINKLDNLNKNLKKIDKIPNPNIFNKNSSKGKLYFLS